MNKSQFSQTLFRRSLALVCFIACTATPFIVYADANPTIVLPDAVAKDLELFGGGVVGKALPAPEITDFRDLLNLGPGLWDYRILAGGKDGVKVRTEEYEQYEDDDGDVVWKRTIGTEYIEYLQVAEGERFGKHLEDDLEVNYSSRFNPSVIWVTRMTPGVPQVTEGTIESFKTDKPDHVSFRGKIKSTLTYVGRYEVTTPAGTWPAILLRSEYDIKIGPAKVTDTTYEFYAEGIGKIAEIETTRVSALLIYHSSTRIAKVLTKYPTH